MIINTLKTIVLLGILTGILLSLGSFIGGTTGIYCALIFSLIGNGIAYFFSDRLVLRLYKAQPLDQVHYKNIYDEVASLAHTMHIPMPRLWLINNPMANAFATGRSPKHGSIALTTGIIGLLSAQELRGVLAHELSHIKNRDILVATIAALVATAIGYIGSMFRSMAFWQSVGYGNKRKQTSPLVLMVIGIITPLVALLLQLAVSRSREYLADETGAHACADPLALASALEKLHNQKNMHHYNNTQENHEATAALFIVHPAVGESMSNLFSTHPPMNRRIKRLHALYEKMFHVR